MANGGWHGTEEEWQWLEAPLVSIDPILEQFALKHGFAVSKNHKNDPERSIRWGANPSCLIQIYLEHDSGPTWNLWLCCSEDRGDSRYWRKEMPVRDAAIEDVRERLPALLEEGFKQLEQWKAQPDELEFATKLSPLS